MSEQEIKQTSLMLEVARDEVLKGIDEDDDLLLRGEVTLVLLKDGGFGGPRPPRTERVSPPERAPEFERRERVADTQALLYRLNGDGLESSPRD